MSEFLQLGEHISIQKGKPPLSIPFHGKGAEIYLSPEYLRNRTAGVSARASSDAVRVSDGATILLWDGSNAGELFKAKEGIVASTMARITPDENFYPAFFFYLLKNAERILKNQTNGTGIPHVDKEILENISVFCPGYAQQHKIAEVLDTLDTAIHKTETIVEKLKQVKQGLLHDLLTRGVNANGELRPSFEEDTDFYKDSPLGWVPKEWDVQLLGDALLGIDAGWSPSCPEEPPLAGEWGVLKVSAVSGGVFQPLESKRLPNGLRPVPSIEVKPGDVILARANGVAELVATTVYVDATPRGLMLSDKTLRLNPNPLKLVSRYLAVLMHHSATRKQIGRMLNGSSGQKNISQSQIKDLVVAIPSVIEQGISESLIRESEQRVISEEVELNKLFATKVGLLNDLLTGRVRVTPLLVQQEKGAEDGTGV